MNKNGFSEHSINNNTLIFLSEHSRNKRTLNSKKGQQII